MENVWKMTFLKCCVNNRCSLGFQFMLVSRDYSDHTIPCHDHLPTTLTNTVPKRCYKMSAAGSSDMLCCLPSLCPMCYNSRHHLQGSLHGMLMAWDHSKRPRTCQFEVSPSKRVQLLLTHIYKYHSIAATLLHLLDNHLHDVA